jgi:hypothetical protein
MLGVERTEVQSIVAGMSAAMAADDNLLLSADEWIKIAGIAARQAAANPGRLFGLSADVPQEALAAQVIQSVLEAAGESWSAGGRTGASVLFGATLETAMEVILTSLSGNVTAIAAQPGLAGQLVRTILEQSAARPEKFGSEGVLTLLRAFMGDVAAHGTLPTADQINEALSV